MNTGFLRGLVDAAYMDQDLHSYTQHFFFSSPSSSLAFWFCIMKLMTCQLTKLRLFFVVVVHVLALCLYNCAQGWVYVCVRAQTLIYICLWLPSACLRVCIECTFLC